MCLLTEPKPGSRGRSEVGTLRKWRLWACPELGSPIPESSVLVLLTLQPSSRMGKPLVGQGLKRISAVVGPVIVTVAHHTVNSGEHLFSWRPVLRILGGSQPASDVVSIKGPFMDGETQTQARNS